MNWLENKSTLQLTNLLKTPDQTGIIEQSAKLFCQRSPHINCYHFSLYVCKKNTEKQDPQDQFCIVVIYTERKLYHFYHFEGYSLVALSTFTLLYSLHHRPLPELSITPNWNSVPTNHQFPISLFPKLLVISMLLYSRLVYSLSVKFPTLDAHASQFRQHVAFVWSG